MTLNEFIVKDTALTWFGARGYTIDHGLHMAHGELRVKDGMSINAMKGTAYG